MSAQNAFIKSVAFGAMIGCLWIVLNAITGYYSPPFQAGALFALGYFFGTTHGTDDEETPNGPP